MGGFGRSSWRFYSCRRGSHNYFRVEDPEAYEFADDHMQIIGSRVSTWWWEHKPNGAPYTRQRVDKYVTISVEAVEVFNAEVHVHTWGTTAGVSSYKAGAWENYFSRLKKGVAAGIKGPNDVHATAIGWYIGGAFVFIGIALRIATASNSMPTHQVQPETTVALSRRNPESSRPWQKPVYWESASHRAEP